MNENDVSSILKTLLENGLIDNYTSLAARVLHTTVLLTTPEGEAIGQWKSCGRDTGGNPGATCILDQNPTQIPPSGPCGCGQGTYLTSPIETRDVLFGYLTVCTHIGSEIASTKQPAPAAAEAHDILGEFARVISELCYRQVEINSITEELLSKYEEINLLYETSEDISCIVDIDSLYRLLIDKIADILEATVISIMLLDDDGQNLYIKAAKGLSDEVIRKARVAMGEKISGYVAQTGKPLLVEDISRNPLFHTKVKEKYITHSLMSVPIRSRGEIIGVLNATDKKSGKIFTASDQKLFVSLSSQAALAIERAQLVEGLVEKEAEKKKMKSTFEQYMPPQVVDIVLQQSKQGVLKNEKQVVTILFTDIRGFTKLSENLEPEEIADMLSQYFNAMTNVIFKYEGTVDKFIGDAVMAVFGAPIYHDSRYGPSDAQRAIYAALEMRDIFKKLESRWARQNSVFKGVDIGIGVNTGIGFCGIIGSKKRLEYTVIGDTVNVASRLCSIAEKGQILTGASTLSGIRDTLQIEELEPVSVKGKAEPLPIFEIIDIDY